MTTLLVGVVIGMLLGYFPIRNLVEWRIARFGARRQMAGRKAYRE